MEHLPVFYYDGSLMIEVIHLLGDPDGVKSLHTPCRINCFIRAEIEFFLMILHLYPLTA